MPYALVPELKLRKTKTSDASATTVLLGAWVTIVEDPGDGFLLVRSFGEEGWVSASEVAEETTAIKLFFVDVGQGDGVLIETPSRRILIDGGQHSHMHDYLAGWKYRWLLDKDEKVHIDAIVVSHFDADHFAGLTDIIEDDRFTIGAISHNGIPRFERRSADRPIGQRNTTPISARPEKSTVFAASSKQHSRLSPTLKTYSTVAV